MTWQMLQKAPIINTHTIGLLALYVSHQSQIEQMMQFDLNEMVDFSFQMARFDCSS